VRATSASGLKRKRSWNAPSTCHRRPWCFASTSPRTPDGICLAECSPVRLPARIHAPPVLREIIHPNDLPRVQKESRRRSAPQRPLRPGIPPRAADGATIGLCLTRSRATARPPGVITTGRCGDQQRKKIEERIQVQVQAWRRWQRSAVHQNNAISVSPCRRSWRRSSRCCASRAALLRFIRPAGADTWCTGSAGKPGRYRSALGRATPGIALLCEPWVTPRPNCSRGIQVPEMAGEVTSYYGSLLRQGRGAGVWKSQPQSLEHPSGPTSRHAGGQAAMPIPHTLAGRSQPEQGAHRKGYDERSFALGARNRRPRPADRRDSRRLSTDRRWPGSG